MNERAQWMWRGVNQVDLTWEDMPLTVQGGSEDYVVRRVAYLHLGSPEELLKVESFLGVDRGDIVETDVHVYGDEQEALYRRSLHKEHMGIYDAYDSREFLHPPSCTEWWIHFGCRTNGTNPLTNRLDSRVHALVSLTFGGAPCRP